MQRKSVLQLALRASCSCNQLQEYLRHCTVFWPKWPAHDLVLVIPPPPLIKDASNTRPCSKLGGTTLNGREEGGQYHISQTCDQQRFEARKVVFSWGVSTFLQLVVAGTSSRVILSGPKKLFLTCRVNINLLLFIG